MLTSILYMGCVFSLLVFSLIQIDLFKSKTLQNNDTAIRHRNIALMCGILCIVLIIAFLANIDEFLSNNQSNKLSYERRTPMQEHSIQAIELRSSLKIKQDNGPLTTERVYYLNQPIIQ